MSNQDSQEELTAILIKLVVTVSLAINNHNNDLDLRDSAYVEAEEAINALTQKLVTEARIAEKDPEYVTWDFLDGMLSSYEAEQRQRAKERGIEL